MTNDDWQPDTKHEEMMAQFGITDLEPPPLSSLSTQMEHLNGIEWHEAPIPRWLHRCKAQTRGWVNYFTEVERCACGAIRLDGKYWLDRNERRKGKKS